MNECSEWVSKNVIHFYDLSSSSLLYFTFSPILVSYRRSFHTCYVIDGLQLEFVGNKCHIIVLRGLCLRNEGEENERKWFAVVEIVESQIPYEWKQPKKVFVVWGSAKSTREKNKIKINGTGVIWQEKWKNFDVIIIIIIIIVNIIKMLLCSIFSFFLLPYAWAILASHRPVRQQLVSYFNLD